MDAQPGQGVLEWLKLAHAPHLGALAAHTLVRQFGSAAATCAASGAALRAHGLQSQTVLALRGEPGDAVEHALRWSESPHHHLLTPDDTAYPALLRELADPPLVLYVRGDPELLSKPQLAIVGSRQPTPAGRRSAGDFAGYLAERGLCITSGLALGVDAAAHEGALAVDGMTVAVAGTGVDRIYPANHQALAGQIEQQGALVSEFALGTPPRRHQFPQRNRLISGLSAGVLVVEAARRSGSLITARLAAQQGREVFAIPGSIHSPLSRGTNALIRDGAKLVETGAHVLEELVPLLGVSLPQCDREPEPAGEHRDSALAALEPEYRKLLEAVDYAPTDVDTLVERTHMAAAEVASMLLILELQGYVEAVSAAQYSRVK